MKRIFDLLFSIIAVLVFLVPMITIAITIHFFCKHSVIFYQERIGKQKKPFEIYKFQTMVDKEVTKLGKILRNSGLDEIPQFINVIKGDMSIVGPRALSFYDINRLNWNSDYHTIRWNIKPGITGFAQLFGGQHKKTSWFWDKKYIESQNLVFDFVIIALSFLMNLIGKKKVRRLIWPNKKLN